MDIHESVRKLSSSDSLDREEGQNELIAIGKPAIPFLLDIVSQNDSRSFYAAHALGILKPSEAIPILLPVLTSDDDSLSGIAAFALVECGYADVPQLTAWLTDLDWRLRRSAALMLGLISATQATEPLISLLHDSHTTVRWQAVRTLGAFKAMDAIPDMTRVLMNTEDVNLKVAIIEAFGKIGDPQVVPLLAPMIKEPITDLRRWTALSFGKIRSPAALSYLREMADNDPDPLVRQTARAELER